MYQKCSPFTSTHFMSGTSIIPSLKASFPKDLTSFSSWLVIQKHLGDQGTPYPHFHANSKTAHPFLKDWRATRTKRKCEWTLCLAFFALKSISLPGTALSPQDHWSIAPLDMEPYWHWAVCTAGFQFVWLFQCMAATEIFITEQSSKVTSEKWTSLLVSN